MKKIFVLTLLTFVFLVFSCADDSTTNNDDNEGNGGNNPLTSAGLVCKVDGKELKFDESFAQSHNPVRDYLILTAPNAAGIQLRMIPNVKGTYKHNDGTNEFRRFNVWFPYEGETYYADNDKGSATITITEVGELTDEVVGYIGFIKASFSGVFVSETGNSINVTDGYAYSVGANQ